MELFGLSSSMTWRNLIHLFVFMVLCMIYPSEEKCKDYFVMENLKMNMTKTFFLVIPKDSKDILKCTAENACRESDHFFCSIVYDCFKSKGIYNNECAGINSSIVPRSHLICLLAHAFHGTIPACDYVRTCETYPIMPIAATTSATTIATTSTLVTAMSITGTPTSTDPTAATYQQSKMDVEMLKVFLKISLTLNLIGPLIVWLCMRRPRLLNYSQTGRANFVAAESENQTESENLNMAEHFANPPSAVHEQDDKTQQDDKITQTEQLHGFEPKTAI